MSKGTHRHSQQGRSRATAAASTAAIALVAALAAAAAFLALALTPADGARAQAAAPSAPQLLLPDLDQDTIRHLMLTRHLPAATRPGVPRRPHFHLGFDSAASNLGDGPLLLHGVRISKRAPIMRADQLVNDASGRPTLYKGIGRLRYTHLSDHQHWHFLDFERYELRDDRTMELIARDQKSGFCLGDRYRSHPLISLPARAAHKVYGDNCGVRDPSLTGIFEGMSVGWGDRYVALLEGQYVDITSVPAGTYQLVNRVNPLGVIHERTLVNDAATDRITITWPRGHGFYPTVRIIGVCPATFGCVGPWPDGRAPIPSDLRNTPFGDALAASAAAATTPSEESP